MDKLDLRRRWEAGHTELSATQTLVALRRALLIKADSGNQRVTVAVHHRDPVLAVCIANELAASYHEWQRARWVRKEERRKRGCDLDARGVRDRLALQLTTLTQAPPEPLPGEVRLDRSVKCYASDSPAELRAKLENIERILLAIATINPDEAWYPSTVVRWAHLSENRTFRLRHVFLPSLD